MLQLQKFTVNPFSENTYILYSKQENAWIIDPGNLTSSESAEIHNFIQQNNLKVERIILTHAHIDHVFGLQDMQEVYKVPVFMHQYEQEILDHLPETAKMFGFTMDYFKGEIQYIKEDEILNLDGVDVKCLLVPGHSPGSLAYYAEDAKLVISGDALFQGSIGRTDLYKGNHAQLISSISEKLLSLPGDTEVHPGHGDSTKIDVEKSTNPFFG